MPSLIEGLWRGCQSQHMKALGLRRAYTSAQDSEQLGSKYNSGISQHLAIARRELGV